MPPDELGDSAGPPPDPLDRLWIHPSELAAARPGVLVAARRRRRRDWGLVLASGAVGALTALTILALTGVLSQSDSAPKVLAAAPEPAETVAARAGSSVVGVLVAVGATTHRVSGVCIGRGSVLTSNDALGGAARATVVTDDGESHAARVVGRDDETDLALLEVDGAPMTSAALRSDGPVVGEAVVALGADDGAHRWVTTGVVSSLSASALGASGAPRVGLVATDLAVSDGAPGGALLDGSSRVVGILTATPKGTVGALAVPVDLARSIADQLRRHGVAEHGWLGIAGGDHRERPTGVQVSAVTASGPAARAGLTADDVITAVDGTTVPSMGDLVADVRRHRPGDEVSLEVWRSGTTRQVAVRLDATPAAPTSTTTTPTTSPPQHTSTVSYGTG